MKKSLAFLFLFSLFCSVAQSSSGYDYDYDEELSLLSIQDPEKAIVKAKNQLLKSELSVDTNKQLIALYYLASASTTLSDYQQSEFYSEKGLLLARKNNKAIFISEFLAFQSYLQEVKGNFREASKLANQALLLAKETGNERLIASQYAMRGQINLSLENYQEAIDDIERSNQTFEKHNDRVRISINYNLLALIYGALDDVDNAIKFLRESIAYDDIKSPFNMAVYHYNLGLTYMQKQEYILAIENLKKSAEIATEIKDLSTVAYVGYGLAEVFIQQEKWQEAEEQINNNIGYFQKSQDVLMHFNMNLLMIDAQANKRNFQQADAYLKQAEQQLKILSTPNSELLYLNTKINRLAKQEKWKEAYDLTFDRDQVWDQMIDKEKEVSLNEMKIRFDAKFDQDKLQFLEKENRLQQEFIIQEKTTRKYMWLLIILIALVFTITYWAYWQQRKTKLRLFQLSQTDDLTGIPNRRYLVEKLTEIYEQQPLSEFPLGVAMIDMDHFKKINDTYGHAKGNETLVHFAKCVRKVIGDKGHVGRLGGEEWLIILPRHDLERLQKTLQALRQSYNQPLKLKLPKDYKLTFSGGVLLCNAEAPSVDQMLKTVDDSLYKAKASGRNQDIYEIR